MKRCLAILLVVLTLALSVDFTALADVSSSQGLMENGRKWLAADALTANGDTAALLTKLFSWLAGPRRPPRRILAARLSATV